MFRFCHVFLSVHCSLVLTCWERADLLALWYMTFYCDFVTFPCGVLGQVLCLVVSIPDLCILSYYDCKCFELFLKVQCMGVQCGIVIFPIYTCI